MIDYVMIGEALALYKRMGYTYIEAPWWVSKEAQYTTMPKHIRSFVIDEYVHDATFEEPVGYLVGSAEQALIQKILDKDVVLGSIVMAGPCFRNEPVVDEFHLKSFFKIELSCVYLAGTQPEKSVERVIYDAQAVHERLSGKKPEIIVTEFGLDLELAGIEVGSYGERTVNGVSWVYGTGLALPRFTQALKKVL